MTKSEYEGLGFGDSFLSPDQINTYVYQILNKPSKLLDWLAKIEAEKIDAQALAMSQPVTEVCMRENPFPWTNEAMAQLWYHPDVEATLGKTYKDNWSGVFKCLHCGRKWLMSSTELDDYELNPEAHRWADFFTTGKEKT